MEPTARGVIEMVATENWKPMPPVLFRPQECLSPFSSLDDSFYKVYFSLRDSPFRFFSLFAGSFKVWHELARGYWDNGAAINAFQEFVCGETRDLIQILLEQGITDYKTLIFGVEELVKWGKPVAKAPPHRIWLEEDRPRPVVPLPSWYSLAPSKPKEPCAQPCYMVGSIQDPHRQPAFECDTHTKSKSQSECESERESESESESESRVKAVEYSEESVKKERSTKH